MQEYQGAEIRVRITGRYFQRHARVRFSGTGITVNTAHFTSSRLLIVAITISGSARKGERDVTVTNPDGQSNTKRRCFKVKKRKAPKIRSVDPNRGRVGTHVNVRITGKDFWGHVTVSFGSGIVVSHVVCVSSELITARLYIRTTAHIGYRDVTVRNPDHQEVTKRNAFRVTRSGDGDDDDDHGG